MSMKIYVHYEADGAPEKTSKMTIPKKWVAEKTVADIIDLFADGYNKKNPDHAIAKDEMHMTNNDGERIYSNAIIGDVISEHHDYFIKLGVYVRENATPTPVAAESRLRCKNYGCGQFFTEEENHDSACKHHVAPPIFHDRVKGWSCCKEKKAYDWEEFQAIEGCSRGRHSTTEPKQLFTASPTVAAAAAAGGEPEAPVLKSIDDYNKQNPTAVTAASAAVKTNAARKSTRRPDGTAKCQNKGCQKDFTVAENNSSACVYHEGQPVFHDAVKFWSCCPGAQCFDFDDFLRVPGCKRGYHDDGEIDAELLQQSN